jgi:hypothetical protein
MAKPNPQKKSQIKAPSKTIRKKQEKGHSETDFLSDLEKATDNDARRKLGLPSPRGPK